MNSASDVERLYLHGSGRTGTAAWPGQGAGAGEYLAFPEEASIEEQVTHLVRDHAGRRVVVYAHSIGAVPAVLAAASSTLDVAGLVLVEPALYDIARGAEAVERHIGLVSEARSLSATGDLRGFWAIMRPLMFGGPFDATRWDQEHRLAEHSSRKNLPWGHGVRAPMVRGIPTLVVTGGWNDEYEEIATVLTAEGAEHRILHGAQHRSQDLPEFAGMVDEFLRRAVGR